MTLTCDFRPLFPHNEKLTTGQTISISSFQPTKYKAGAIPHIQASMPAQPSPQSLHRDVRRLLRQPLMSEVTDGSSFMAETTRLFARRYVVVGNHPHFALVELHSLVQRALRLVETGRRPWAVYNQFCKYITQALILTKGLFCGHRRPELDGTFCTICQSDGPENWWHSMACGHHFHEACMFTHLGYDERCPLCRVKI